MDFLQGAVEENRITVQYVFHEELNFLKRLFFIQVQSIVKAM